MYGKVWLVHCSWWFHYIHLCNDDPHWPAPETSLLYIPVFDCYWSITAVHKAGLLRPSLWLILDLLDCPVLVHSTEKPVTTMLTYPWKCTVLFRTFTVRDNARCSVCACVGNVQFYIVTTWETPGNHWCWWPNTLIITLASARAIIKVSGHQHQWFPGVSQVVTM